MQKNKLPDGHICVESKFRSYPKLVCSLCTPEHYKEAKDVYFADNLPTEEDIKGEIEHLKECLLEHDGCMNTAENEINRLSLALKDAENEIDNLNSEIKSLHAEIEEGEEETKLVNRYSNFCKTRNDLVKKAAKPILDKWDEYVKSGQSVTAGTGETTICIPTRHVQHLVYAVKYGKSISTKSK